MSNFGSSKIDIFPHILPPRYKEALFKATQSSKYIDTVMRPQINAVTTLYDLEHRFRIMDKYEGLVQVITLGTPPVEAIPSSKDAVDLARLANDEMAELVVKYPDRFVAAVACLPMNNMDAALIELDRAINDLGFRGVQLYTSINGKPLDSPEFIPVYEKMSQYDLPIWIHPQRWPDYADYRTADSSKYKIYHVFGWPYETTAAMTHLVFSGILERYPNLKFITHHCGGMVPYFAQRIIGCYDIAEKLWGGALNQGLTGPQLARSPVDYFKMFYNDTALYGHTPGLMCAYTFCGADHLLFGTDMPLDSEFGDRYTRQTIDSIEKMDIGDLEKKMIFEDNARRLLHLLI